MLILNCTKNAADFFSTTKKGKKLSPLDPAPLKTIAASNDNRQWQWLVHAIKVKGKNVLVVMDYHTRFSITLSGLKKGDDSTFMNSLEHHLAVHVHEMMTSINADSKAIEMSLERYRHKHNSCAFYMRGERSVQAHINDVVWHFNRLADNSGEVPIEVNLISFDVFMNEFLRKRKSEKDYFTPHYEFLHKWLRSFGEYSAAKAGACIDSLKAMKLTDVTARHPILNSSSGHTDKPCLQGKKGTSSSNVITLDDYRKK